MSNEFIVGTILAVLALVISYIALKKDHFSKPKEELNHLKLQFNMTKALSEKVQKQIEHHIAINNAENKLIFENMTFGKYLFLIKENYNDSFSDARYKFLDSKELTKPNILSLTKSLETQFQNLQQVENMMKTLL